MDIPLARRASAHLLERWGGAQVQVRGVGEGVDEVVDDSRLVWMGRGEEEEEEEGWQGCGGMGVETGRKSLARSVEEEEEEEEAAVPFPLLPPSYRVRL